MKEASSDSRYRASAVQEATPTGLVVILYDILVGDLRRAITCMRSGNVEERCGHLKHGFSVLQLLEGSLDLQNGGDTAQSLSDFYSYIRNQILIAQFQSDVRILERQIALILSVREAWQEVDSVLAAQTAAGPVLPDDSGFGSNTLRDVQSAGWSA